jgi:uncharacterized protein (TIGR02266 family)
MAYSGATTARQARENLGRALAALQQDPNIPPDVLAVAQNIAQAVGALFEAERASSEPDGKASVKSALGLISQTLALLQEVRGQHQGVNTATESIAQTLSMLFPLSTQPSRMPPPGMQPPAAADASSTVRDPQPFGVQPQRPPAQFSAPAAQPPQQFGQAPQFGGGPAQPATKVQGHPGYRDTKKRENIEINIGATTESNFYVGFSGDIGDGGVFAATYNILPKGTPVSALVTLPGGFEKTVNGYVRFVRDPMDMNAESEPGMGIQFEQLEHEARELILRFIRKRPPMFYDE